MSILGAEWIWVMRFCTVWFVGGLAVLVAGCGGALGQIGRITRSDGYEGLKMLRPGFRVTECENSVVGGTWSGQGRLADQAIERMLGIDDEATEVVNVRMETSWWTVGVFSRRCLTIVGDVARSTSLIRLPMAGNTSGHCGH